MLLFYVHALNGGREKPVATLRVCYPYGVRYRLRFLLQEFDLVGPSVAIGRSPGCQVTIEDPLVSRRHAVIHISKSITIQDLGSRNGVRVNGNKIEGTATIVDGDRLRLGTQELVFSILEGPLREAKATGFMTHCHVCETPYPDRAPSCPHCGAGRHNEETLSGLVSQPSHGWTLSLLLELTERMHKEGKTKQAEKILQRAAREIDERLGSDARMEGSELEQITQLVLKIITGGGDAKWFAWVLNLHRQEDVLVSKAFASALSEQDLPNTDAGRNALRNYADWAAKKDPKWESLLLIVERC